MYRCKAIITRILTLIFAQILLFHSTSLGANGDGKAHRALIVMSSNLWPYQKAANGIKDFFGENPSPVQIKVIYLTNIDKKNGLQKTISDFDPQVILPIGTEATLTTIDSPVKTPIVLSMVLHPGKKIMDDPRTTGVLLDIPIRTQILWFKLIVPTLKKIGIIYTENTEDLIDIAVSEAPSLGVTIVPLKIHDIADITNRLEELTKSADALLAVPDSTIYNPVITPHLILFTLRHKMPFMGLSRNFTKSGALFSLDSDYYEIGKKAGTLALRIIQGEKVENLPFVHPDKVVPVFNHRIARLLGIELDDSLIRMSKGSIPY